MVVNDEAGRSSVVTRRLDGGLHALARLSSSGNLRHGSVEEKATRRRRLEGHSRRGDDSSSGSGLLVPREPRRAARELTLWQRKAGLKQKRFESTSWSRPIDQQ